MMWPWFNLLWVFGVAIAVTTVLLHCVFAAVVFVDSRRLVNRDKLKPAMVPGEIWAISTLLGGVFVAIGYWIIHRSSISNLETIKADFDIREYLS